MTLHPASQNFSVEIKYECCKPGTMRAPVILFGIHGISKLQVCVEYIMLPSGNLIAMGNLDTLTCTTADPSTRKYDNMPESESV